MVWAFWVRIVVIQTLVLQDVDLHHKYPVFFAIPRGTTGKTTEVTVEDKGVGLPPDVDPSDPKSNLVFLKSRAVAINIDITTEPGAGVSVYIEFELARETVGIRG